jgi:hypothetical protein
LFPIDGWRDTPSGKAFLIFFAKGIFTRSGSPEIYSDVCKNVSLKTMFLGGVTLTLFEHIALITSWGIEPRRLEITINWSV